MSRGNIVAIVNSKLKEHIKTKIVNGLRNVSIDYIETTHPGDAIACAKNSDAEILVAVGGDGTVNEVLNGMNIDKQRLAIVPAGSLNMISNGIGIANIDQGLALLEGNHSVSQYDYLDVKLTYADGHIDKKRVLGFTATGYDSAVVRNALGLKGVSPQLRYVLAGWISFLTNRPYRLRYTINGHLCKARLFTSVVINNCCADAFSSIKKYSGQDGTFEMLIVNTPYILQIMYVLLSKVGLNGGYRKNISDTVLYWGTPLSVMADGECYDGVVSMSITIRKESLKVLCKSI